MRSVQLPSRLFPVCVLAFTISACSMDATKSLNPAPASVITPANGATIVNTLTDDGDGTCTVTKCTLRDAISVGAAYIDLSGLTGTITLDQARGQLVTSGTMSITGPGASSLAVSGGDQVRVFQVEAGASLSIASLTVRDGNGSLGGAILVDGTLSLSRVVVTSSASGSGGGLANYGTATISESTISANQATIYGGGIANFGTLSVQRSTLSGNSANYGGGIYSEMTSTLTKVLTVVNSTVSGNSATFGGGIYNQQGVAYLTANTITNNTASGAGNGGGVYASTAQGTMTNVKMSLIWGNHSGSSTADDVAENSGGTSRYASLGYNYIGAAGDGVDFSLELNMASDHTNAPDPLLGTLALNSPGVTETHALLSGSPAINDGVCLDHNGNILAIDQRGTGRPQGPACDIGAYERVLTFESACTYTINPKNGQRVINITWLYASPGVTVIRVTGDGRPVQKSMPPTYSGSWEGKIRTGTPTYEIWGGNSRGEELTNLVVAGAACVSPT